MNKNAIALVAGLAAITLLTATTTTTDAAAADNKAGAPECWTAAERAQELRRASKLRAAAESARVCVRDACHPEARLDCEAIMKDLAALTPSIVVRAKDARGRDVAGVTVLIDGDVAATSLDGRSIALDPGVHRVRVSAAHSSSATFEQSVLLTVRETNRPIEAHFDEALEVDGSPVVVSTTVVSKSEDAKPTPPTTEPRPLNAMTLLFGGISVVGTGMFTGFEIAGQSDYVRLANGCGRTKTCSEDDVSPAHTKFVVAGAALGIALVAGGAALYFALFSHGHVNANANAAKRSPALIAF